VTRSDDARYLLDERLRRVDALFFVDVLAGEPSLTDDDLHHLLSVLRPRVGSVIGLSDGDGSWCRMSITALPIRQRRSSTRLADMAQGLEFAQLDEVVTETRQRPELTVAFAMPKGDRMDLIVQKLTEIGIDNLVPLITKRTVVRLDEREAARRRDRLSKIAREACSQSRRLFLPVIHEPQSLDQFLRGAPVGIAFAEPGGSSLGSEVQGLIVGPEGGWEPDELSDEYAKVGLGSTVLRVETAAIAAGALLSAIRANVVHHG
jgi:16S rRNA (uracil1498-N3)-methyltransferase